MHLKDNGVNLDLSGLCEVVSHMTIRITVVNFLWVVPLYSCIYLAPLWRYGTSNVGRTEKWKHRCSGDFILCPMQCTALDRQQWEHCNELQGKYV